MSTRYFAGGRYLCCSSLRPVRGAGHFCNFQDLGWHISTRGGPASHDSACRSCPVPAPGLKNKGIQMTLTAPHDALFDS
jgi:hypothetical protein